MCAHTQSIKLMLKYTEKSVGHSKKEYTDENLSNVFVTSISSIVPLNFDILWYVSLLTETCD